MPLSLFEIEALKDYAEKYGKEFKNAIHKKKVARRRTLLPTRFSAPVNNTGTLADSYTYKIDEQTGQVEMSAADYLQFLIFGRQPQQDIKKSRPPISAIEEWMRSKGITDVSPFAIANSIAKNGSSIYRQYKGEPSNLLNDIPLQELNEELIETIGRGYVGTLGTQLVERLQMEDLNFEL